MRIPRSIKIFLFVALISGFGSACSLAPGYFHQVTAIRGRVVGKNLGPVQFRWLRQAFRVRSASLTIYEYRSPAKISDLKPVSTAKTDSRGEFDFGPLAKGHYILIVSVRDTDELGGSFDIEVTDRVKATDAITLDVSPIHPACTGGHEFIENKKS